MKFYFGVLTFQDMPVDVWEKVLENPPAPLTQVSAPQHCGIHVSVMKVMAMSVECCYRTCYRFWHERHSRLLHVHWCCSRMHYVVKGRYIICDMLQSERSSWLAKLQRVALSSDAFFPFRDNIDRAAQVRH